MKWNAISANWKCGFGNGSAASAGCVWLKALPGVGEILDTTIHLEIDDVKRFASARHLASYAGLVPTVHASGGRCQAGHYLCLRWAFVEAANCVVMHGQRYSQQHVVQFYERLKPKCPSKAAMAGHLAEAGWWILTKREISAAACGTDVFVQERVSAASESSPLRLLF
ncbi:MAG TPA: IS110 family transposase [Bryobacteraceae bacterium]|nr:IS110 family transposase [Bryobacteraceae bacterium]